MTYAEFVKRSAVADSIIKKMINLKQQLWDEYHELNSQEIIEHAEDLVRSEKDRHPAHPDSK